jgi:hypothetical protein
LIPGENISSKIVCGVERVHPLLDGTAALEVLGSPVAVSPPKEASIVWVTDYISNILQRVCIQIKNNPNLKRLLIITTNPAEIAGLMKSEPYRFLFEHPAFKIALIDPNEPPDLGLYRSIFSPSAWDLRNETTFQYSFRPEFSAQEEWLAQIRALYMTIMLLFRDGLGSSAYTEDAFLGFRNAMLNLPRTLRSPDIRNWKGLGKKRTAFLVGAGPSMRTQLDYLKSVKDHVIIIAADTMLKPLTKAGIEPHFLASMERAPEIIDLLNDPNDHPETFLVGSAVLEPECFASFRGPQTIYASGLPYSKWFPFERIRLGSGHSCMGLAMTLATHLQCSSVYLMGIDLCWSETGDSHMTDVPYLQKQFYQEQNKKLFANSFATQNTEGKTVRTNEFWTVFKQQFEYWAKNYRGDVFNLSPTGLPLKGVPNVSLDQAKIDKRPLDVAKEFSKALPYNRTSQVLVEIKNFSYQLNEALPKFADLLSQMENVAPKKALEILESQDFYQGLLSPILRSEVHNLTLEEENDVKGASLENIRKFIPRIEGVLKETDTSLKALMKEQAVKHFPLY